MNPSSNFLTRPLLCCLLASISVTGLHAQTAVSISGGVRVFEPAYFQEFDPVSALDLVARTPGFNVQEQSGGRGLSGVRSNILINPGIDRLFRHLCVYPGGYVADDRQLGSGRLT